MAEPSLSMGNILSTYACFVTLDFSRGNGLVSAGHGRGALTIRWACLTQIKRGAHVSVRVNHFGSGAFSIWLASAAHLFTVIKRSIQNPLIFFSLAILLTLQLFIRFHSYQRPFP